MFGGVAGLQEFPDDPIEFRELLELRKVAGIVDDHFL